MKKRLRKVISWALVLGMSVTAVNISGTGIPGIIELVQAEEQPVKFEPGMTDVQSPREGNILIEVSGSSKEDDYEAAIDIHHYLTGKGLHGKLYANESATETAFFTAR